MWHPQRIYKFSRPGIDWLRRPALFRQPSRPAKETKGSALGMAGAQGAENGPYRTMETLNFDNLALRTLPIDPIEEVYARNVSGACFSRARPIPVENPKLVAYSAQAADLLGLQKSEMERTECANFFSGNELFPGSEPAAHCYCGHQFGYFSGQLGDGAAMYLGEVVNHKGERWEIQLKGAGKTPYSREADGRKVLRSSIREFLCSEAMHYLGIPTTRAVACVTSDSRIVRDIFYNGNPIYERCTIVCRIAQTFIRFGSFEIFKTLDALTGRVGPSVGRKDILVKLLHYTISTFYAEIYEEHKDNEEEMYLQFFTQVVKRTAKLISLWQCVGFCHGVLNTDNMSIAGLTIDYGPFGFLDFYDPDHICNGSDDGGRYSYSSQPSIGSWNLRKLAEALQPVLPLTSSISALDEIYMAEFEKHYLQTMRTKLGLLRKQLPEDRNLVDTLLKTMESTGADFTNCFRGLSKLSLPACAHFEETLKSTRLHLVDQCSSLEDLRLMYKPRMEERAFVSLLQQHPEILDQLGKKADALQQELERRKRFLEIGKLTEANKRLENESLWDTWLEQYKSRLEKEVDGENDPELINEERCKAMNSINPRIILRNYLLQVAIEAAEKGDYTEVNKLLELVSHPYHDIVNDETRKKQSDQSSSVGEVFHDISRYDAPAPRWARSLRVT